jgi:hypothetical protein
MTQVGRQDRPDQDMNDAGQIISAGKAAVYLLSPAMRTTLQSSPNPASVGQTVTFTAAVISVEDAPPDGERLDFYIDRKIVATVPLDGGEAWIHTSNLKVGTHTSSALYLENLNYDSGKSAVNSQVARP